MEALRKMFGAADISDKESEEEIKSFATKVIIVGIDTIVCYYILYTYIVLIVVYILICNLQLSIILMYIIIYYNIQ